MSTTNQGTSYSTGKANTPLQLSDDVLAFALEIQRQLDEEKQIKLTPMHINIHLGWLSAFTDFTWPNRKKVIGNFALRCFYIWKFTVKKTKKSMALRTNQ